MKSKFLLIPALLLGATALGGAAVALTHKNVARAAKADEISPWTITDDMYECAFLEQYDDTGTAATTENYSYNKDRPLGVDTICGYQYGIGGPVAVNLKKTSWDTNLYGVNETLTWRFSGIQIKSKTSPNRLYAQIENNSTNWNMMNTTNFPESTCPDEYALGQIMTGMNDSNINRAGAMISNSVIKNIQDMSFFWRSSYTRRLFIYYQLENETEWKLFHQMNCDDDLRIAGNYSGTHGWDAKGYTTFNSESWTTKELYGANAKIALVIAGKESGNLPLSAILINANNAAVRYLNTLSYKDNICSANGTNMYFDLNKGQSDGVHNQDLFQLATERAEGSFLADYIVVGGKTTEYYALGLYNHLVTSIPALGSVKAASSNYFMNMNNNANVAIIVSVSVAAAAVIGAGLFFGLRKRKHN